MLRFGESPVTYCGIDVPKLQKEFLAIFIFHFLSCPRQDDDYKVEVLEVRPGDIVKYPKLHKWLKITMFSFVESEDLYDSVNFSCASFEILCEFQTLKCVLRAKDV